MKTTKVKSAKRIAIMEARWKDPEYRARRLATLHAGRDRILQERREAKDRDAVHGGDGDAPAAAKATGESSSDRTERGTATDQPHDERGSSGLISGASGGSGPKGEATGSAPRSRRMLGRWRR